MGKNNENLSKKYRNNVRVDPASISHFLCYFCGKISFDRLEYQQHMLKVHEVISQSYQLWSDHTMDSLGLRWSDSKRPDEHDGSGSFAASPKSRTPKVKDSDDDDDEDYIYEEDERTSKKRRRDDEGAKFSRKKTVEKLKRDELRRKTDAENKRKKRAEERRREEIVRRKEEERKAEEARKELEVKESEKVEVEVPRRVEYFELGKRTPSSSEKRKRRRPEGSRRKEEVPEKDEPEVEALVKKILEESKKKEASRQETEDEDISQEPSSLNRRPLEANANTTKYCKVCKKGTHYNFATLFEHYIQHHHATVKSFHYYGYAGMKLIGKKLLVERENCQRCFVKFPSAFEYYKHMIANHIFESVRCQPDFEAATHADVETRLAFRDRILNCGYRFSLNPEDQATTPTVVDEEPEEQPNTSDVETDERNDPEQQLKEKQEDETREEIKEEPKEEPKEGEPSTSTAVETDPQ